MAEPAWLVEARKYIGITETPGPDSNPEIISFWRSAKLSGIKSDTVPWCAGFACAVLERVGIKSPRADSARSFATFGKALKEPKVGAIVVFSREGGAHVGFLTGIDAEGRLLVLGGNQADAVNIRAFSPLRVIAYRWPAGVEESKDKLAVGKADVSTSEA